MKTITTFGFLTCFFSLVLIACSNTSPTLGYINTIGHEVLHCFFGQWHKDRPNEHNLTVYPDLDFKDKLTEISTISLYFLPNDEVQAKYREYAKVAIDKNVVAVHGFNVRYLNSHACEIYIAIV